MKNFIGLNIKHLCDTNKLSQEEFGNIFGLKKSAVSSYVNQRASPPYEVAMQIADHFGFTLDDLIRHPLNLEKYIEFASKEKHPQNKRLTKKDKYISLQDKYIEKLEKEINELKNEDV